MIAYNLGLPIDEVALLDSMLTFVQILDFNTVSQWIDTGNLSSIFNCFFWYTTCSLHFGLHASGRSQNVVSLLDCALASSFLLIASSSSAAKSLSILAPELALPVFELVVSLDFARLIGGVGTASKIWDQTRAHARRWTERTVVVLALVIQRRGILLLLRRRWLGSGRTLIERRVRVDDGIG